MTGLVMGNTWFWPTARLVGKLFSVVMSSPPMQWAILERNWFVEGLIPKGTAHDLTKREMDHYRAVQPDREARAGVAEFPRQLRKAGPWLAGLQWAVRRELADRPLLLTWGMQDFAFPPDSTLPRWRATFADARLVPLDGAKHFIQEDAPAEIADAIAERFGG